MAVFEDLSKYESKYSVELGENIFIKFFPIGDMKYADNLINNGELFFGSIKRFIELNDGDRGDSNEFLITKSPGLLCAKLDSDDKYRVLFDLRNNPGIRVNTNKCAHIYCLSDFMKKDLSKLEGVYSLGEKYINGFAQGQEGLVMVIIDKDKFLHRIHEYFGKNNISYQEGNIDYSDLGKNDLYYFFENKAMFRKGKDFSYQQEYRFIIDDENEADKVISIGSLRDCSVKLELLDVEKCKDKIIYD